VTNSKNAPNTYPLTKNELNIVDYHRENEHPYSLCLQPTLVPRCDHL